MSRRILITGGSGQVGWELRRTLAPLGEIAAPGRDQLDLCDLPRVQQYIADFRPDWIVNAAAYTAVDRAEEKRAEASLLNQQLPALLADEVSRSGGVLIHYSTDYIFNGEQQTPYREDDVVSPLNHYGASKWAGEEAVRHRCEKHLIFRTSWVYGTRGHNFLLTIQRLARERDEITVVADQIGAPTWSRQIAEATALVILQAQQRNHDWGTYHLSSQGETSWFGFAQQIIALTATGHSLNIRPITTADYPTVARRPSYSCLDGHRLYQTFGVQLPQWQEALELCLDHTKKAR